MTIKNISIKIYRTKPPQWYWGLGVSGYKSGTHVFTAAIDLVLIHIALRINGELK